MLPQKYCLPHAVNDDILAMSENGWEQLSGLLQGMALILLGTGLADIFSEKSQLGFWLGLLLLLLFLMTGTFSIYFAN